jgi:urate oxidase
MKKAPKKNDEMLREYDFSKGIRGKYARRYAQGSNVVVLEPDVAKVFPNAEAVNSSLRSLAEIIRRRKSLAEK